jgi:hypothetical protein
LLSADRALPATAQNIAAILPNCEANHTFKRCQNTEIKKAAKNHTTGLHSTAQSSSHLYTAHGSFIAQKACIRQELLHNRCAQDSDKRNALHFHLR